MRCALVVTLVALLTPAAAAASASASTAGETSLRIVYRATESAPARVLTLHCAPPRGTVRNPARACSRLTALGRGAFRPTPRDKACTMIYGGPQTAVVSGMLDGVRVWARFARRDGCEIGRWNGVAFLFPLR